MLAQDDKSRQYTVSSLNTTEEDRLQKVLAHFEENKVYTFLPSNQRTPETLDLLRKRYRQYRENWRVQPENNITECQSGLVAGELSSPPLCVDIEVASICDLACPFCYRQYIATADGLMKKDLFFSVVDQCVEMGVPSIKLNWRGEGLLHPALPEFIEYAKRKGILEVLLNSNAVKLSKEKGKALIDAGLDVLIYSFDGGSAETYNQMRPGRFEPNSFDKVYENIRCFNDLRVEEGSLFPRTRIQMIITKDSANEVVSFYQLFSGVVDDVSTKAYSERGGNINDFDPNILKALESHFVAKGLNDFKPDPEKIWLTSDNQILYATDRLPCQQLFQRLVVTYDGRVHMCCYDWAGVNTIGFVSERAYVSGDIDLQEVIDKTQKGEKGFSNFTGCDLPKRVYEPEHKVQHLREIWNSDHLKEIRKKHCSGMVNNVNPCHGCNFRDTYTWEKIGQ